MKGFINDYKGAAIASEKSYVCFKKGICSHIKWIKLFGYMSETPGEVDLVLDIRFNSGYNKMFKLEIKKKKMEVGRKMPYLMS